MYTRAVRWGIGLGLVAILAIPSRPSVAGDPAPVADAVGRVMEAATTRMKAALEEARLLEAAGRRDDALALLRTVPAIHDEANRIVRTLVGGPVPAARAEGPAVRPPKTPPPPTVRARVMPPHDPIRPAVEFLLRCQRPNGMFDPLLGAAPHDATYAVDPKDALLEPTTGAVLLALLDVSGPRVFPDTPVGRAIVRAADALSARPAADPLPTLAAWGLATAVSRTGETRWMPAVLRSVEATVEGLARTLGGAFPTQLPNRLVFEAAFLHEVLALPVEAALAARIRTALASLRTDVRAFDRRRLSTPAQRVAYDLLAPDPTSWRAHSLPREPAAALDPTLGRSGDPVEILLGTVYVKAVFDLDDEAEGSAWWNDVLVPRIARQVPSRETAGSWDPPAGGTIDGTGRVVTTALMLLAWKVPSTPFHPPVPWKPQAPLPDAPPANDDDADDAADDDDR